MGLSFLLYPPHSPSSSSTFKMLLYNVSLQEEQSFSKIIAIHYFLLRAPWKVEFVPQGKASNPIHLQFLHCYFSSLVASQIQLRTFKKALMPRSHTLESDVTDLGHVNIVIVAHFPQVILMHSHN